MIYEKEVRRLKKDKSDLLLQLKENDNKIQEMAKVHLERISQLETKIQYLNIEKERQKSLTSEHLQKERERLDKIAEVRLHIHFRSLLLLLRHDIFSFKTMQKILKKSIVHVQRN